MCSDLVRDHLSLWSSIHGVVVDAFVDRRNSFLLLTNVARLGSD
jgi:hypothetical protein